jgi:hypothetical protein
VKNAEEIKNKMSHCRKLIKTKNDYLQLSCDQDQSRIGREKLKIKI